MPEDSPTLAVMAPGRWAPPLPTSRIHHPSPSDPFLAVCDEMDRGITNPRDVIPGKWIAVPDGGLPVTCKACLEWRHA